MVRLVNLFGSELVGVNNMSLGWDFLSCIGISLIEWARIWCSPLVLIMGELIVLLLCLDLLCCCLYARRL